MEDPLDISHEISCALNRNEPVVALESSVIAHGLPRPVNVQAAIHAEEQVRGAGAVPATIGVIEGKIRVGLTKSEIEKLGKKTAAKLAARDLPYAVATKLDGGTTVSATVRVASAVGISVVATGGIGGVHIGFDRTHDVSADLWELARTPIIVVCSGAKAVLDVHATMEWLETHGVPVYGFETDELPAFYSRSSGIAVPKLEGVDDMAEVARLSGGMMGMRCAMVVAVPIPKRSEVGATKQIEQAAREASDKGISGKDLTPYLLDKVGKLTKGKSTDANLALLNNNAKVAAKIAGALARRADARMGFTV